MSEKNIRVMLVDDHELILQSITKLLVREEDMEVVATARDGLQAIRLAETLSPDVIVMDVSMPQFDGIRAAGKIRELVPESQVIMFSMHKNSTLLQQAKNSGAVAYISKEQAQNDLIPAIRDASTRSLLT